MKKHILHLDDSDVKLACLAIRSSSSDFEVTFQVNSTLGICLERIPDHTLKMADNQVFFFSTFAYDDEERMINWYLISNRSHPLSIDRYTRFNNSLFDNIDTETYIFLVPDQKIIDYWLLLDCESTDIKPIIHQLQSVLVFISVYPFDLKKSKFKSNLLLF